MIDANMIRARRPNMRQRKIIQKVGLDPELWDVTTEDENTLHITDRHFEHRELLYINKRSYAVTFRAPGGPADAEQKQC